MLANCASSSASYCARVARWLSEEMRARAQEMRGMMWRWLAYGDELLHPRLAEDVNGEHASALALDQPRQRRPIPVQRAGQWRAQRLLERPDHLWQHCSNTHDTRQRECLVGLCEE